MVDGEVQRGQLLVGGEIRCLPSIRQQRSLVNVRPGQQQLRVRIVLQEIKGMAFKVTANKSRGVQGKGDGTLTT